MFIFSFTIKTINKLLLLPVREEMGEGDIFYRTIRGLSFGSFRCELFLTSVTAHTDTHTVDLVAGIMPSYQEERKILFFFSPYNA